MRWRGSGYKDRAVSVAAEGPFDADLPESDPACPPGSIPWALDQGGNSTHITQVKARHTYRCPVCKGLLTAVLNTRRRQHFRHRKGHECSHPYDTSLHEAAKQVIKKGSEKSLPAVIALHAGRRVDISNPGIFRYDDVARGDPCQQSHGAAKDRTA